MKKAAVVALAELAKESVPEQVNIAYGETKLNFGKDYIIPKPFDPRLIARIPLAVAKAAIESASLVASLMAKETGKDEQWIKEQINIFISMAKNYLPNY